VWRKLSITGIALGLLLALGGGLMRWVVAPAMAVLPGDTDTTRTYSGTAAVLLNPAAIASGGQVLLTNAPITVVHHTKVLGTSGDNALVSDAKTVRTGGTTVAAVDYRYAVNRTDMGEGAGYSGVVKQTGITFNWPIRTQQKDYTGWVADTGRTTVLHYKGTATRGGVQTYVFTANTQVAPITDPQLLSQLPTSMPKAALVQLAGGLGLPSDQLAGLQQLLPALPDPVKFAYNYQATATYWVAPDSGIVVDATEHQVRTIALVTGTTAVPVTRVLDLTFTSPPATLAAAAQDARDKGDAVTLAYVTLPIALASGGVLFVLLGVVGLFMSRRRPPTPQSAPREFTPVG
jgi:hypothetical protein